MDKSGNLYGTTDLGGGYQFGVVYKLMRTGRVWKETVLHSFSGYPSDGNNAATGVIFDSEGNMYGTTLFGGAGNAGTVFKLAGSGRGTRETVLFSFDGANGYQPMAGLTSDQTGGLIGTTSGGGSGTGCSDGCGVVFEITP